MKSFSIRWSDQAVKDAEAFVDYFESQQESLGHRFVDSIEETLNLIRRAPYGGAAMSPHFPANEGVRRWPIRHFRNYYIDYEVDTNEIALYRILHAARGAVS